MISQLNIVLTGFMGVGKSTIGRQVAQRLDRPFIDMDAAIESRTGLSIHDIFAQQGEDGFRKHEQALCRELAKRSGLVIATGGGALIPAENRKLMAQNGLLICLTCDLDELVGRVEATDDRPLVDQGAIRESLSHLMDTRDEAYAAMPWHIDTTRRSIEAVVDDVLLLANAQCRSVCHASGRYPIHIGKGMRHHLGDTARASGLPAGARVLVVSNDVVFPLYGAGVVRSLKTAGYSVDTCVIPDGEHNKTLDTVRLIYNALVAHNVDRNGAVISLGGGVTGDIAGFAAATYLRGIHFIQVPTTLLAMVDASVGGKTGVDLPAGKNLVGAFWQPDLVLIDPQVLETLRIEELRSGIAETLKHGVIANPVLFEQLIHSPVDHAFWSSERAVTLITEALHVKIAIVEEDPFEKGRRAVLNLGHTLGHALEVLSNYELRHGHAVAIGLVAATRMAVELALAPQSLVHTIERALQHLGLDIGCPPYSVSEIEYAMRRDKKRAQDEHRWVLPDAIGHATPDHIVPETIVREVLIAMGARRNP